MEPEKTAENTVGNKQHQNNSPQGHKKDRKKHDKKPIKHERPAEYERNADLITIDTELEPLPKKGELLRKPELK